MSFTGIVPSKTKITSRSQFCYFKALQDQFYLFHWKNPYLAYYESVGRNWSFWREHADSDQAGNRTQDLNAIGNNANH